MRRLALLVLVPLLTLLLAVCGGSGHPHVWASHLLRPHAYSACASADCGAYPVVLHWDVTVAGAQGYFVSVNGVQVADVASQPYTVYGLDCGSTYTIGVQAHGTGGASQVYTIPLSTPACGGGPVPANTIAPYFCGAVPLGTIVSGEAFGVTGCATTTGSAVVGQALAVGRGVWTNNPTGFSYQWQDCTTTGGTASLATTGSCSNIPGATSSTYTIQPADAGHALVPIVTASNGSGTSTPTTPAGSCDTGSVPPYGNQSTGQGNDPIEPAGCSPISAVVASTAGTGAGNETYCTNALVTCGYPDPLSGNVGIPPGTALTNGGFLTCAVNQVVTGEILTGVTPANGCHINNSLITGSVGGSNTAGLTGVQLTGDNMVGTHTGDAISSTCTGSNGVAGTDTELQWEAANNGLTITGTYLHCAAETLNGGGNANGSYLVSDECYGACDTSSTTHNEAVYFAGGCNPCNASYNNDVFINEYNQTAAFFGDDHAFGTIHGLSVTNSLAIAGGGFIGITCGSNGNSNTVGTGNRLSGVYQDPNAQGDGGTTWSGNVIDSTLASIGAVC